MKMLGILLLILGVIVSASAGIRLGEADFQATVVGGRAALTNAPAPVDAAPVAAATRLGDWFDDAGGQFLAGLALLVIGAVIGRIAMDRGDAAETTADGRDFGSQLSALADAIEAALQALHDKPLNETRARIERSLEQLLLPMIEARGMLQRRFGLGGSALVLGPLSGAERQLNRAWSALVDEHTGEGETSLAAAAAEVELARQALEDLHAGQA